MKKKKSGSVAIPFLITFLISLVIVGGVAMFIYDKINSDDSSLISMANEVGTLSKDDSHTIMFVIDMSDTVSGDTEETESYEESDEWESEDDAAQASVSDEPYTFIVMRSEPINKQLTFMGVPCNMQIGKENRKSVDIYIDNGVSALKNGLEFTLGIEIDRYMILNTEAFKKVCNIMGGVNYPVPKGVEGLEASKDEQYLSADQISAIITSGGLAGGEQQRISTAAALIASMTNQAKGVRIAENLDNSFNALSEMTETDISAVDYDEKKYAVKFMLKYSDPENEDSGTRSTRANFITPYGDNEGDGFIADRYFAEDISSVFEPTKQDDNSSKKSSDRSAGAEDKDE